MDTARELPNQQTFINPDNELPAPPEEKQLPQPHDMLLKAHFTHRHSWIHWLPAIFGLLIGMFVGIYFIGGAETNRKQIENYYQQQPTQADASNNILEYNIKDWVVFKNHRDGYEIKVPTGWKASLGSGGGNGYISSIIDSNIPGGPSIAIDYQKLNDAEAKLTPKDWWKKLYITDDHSYLDYIKILEEKSYRRNGADYYDVYSELPIQNDQIVKSKKVVIIANSTLYYISVQKTSYNTYDKVAKNIDPYDIKYRKILNEIITSITFPEAMENPKEDLSIPVTLTPAPTVANPQSNQVACTMDAKQCPDGSWVGRAGPNCEFLPCTNVQP